jgi:hypothetical protein
MPPRGGRRGHGSTGAAGDPHGARRLPRRYTPYPFRILGIDGLHADRRNCHRHRPDPSTPARPLRPLVPCEAGRGGFERRAATSVHMTSEMRLLVSNAGRGTSRADWPIAPTQRRPLPSPSRSPLPGDLCARETPRRPVDSMQVFANMPTRDDFCPARLVELASRWWSTRLPDAAPPFRFRKLSRPRRQMNSRQDRAGRPLHETTAAAPSRC